MSESDGPEMVQSQGFADKVAAPGLAGPSVVMRKQGSEAKPVQIRKEFPETWLFESFDMKNESLHTISKKVPDTITSWIITGFSINEQSGIGIVDNPSKFKVFQPFFVTTNLPYSIKRGEVVSIPILVFNYLSTDQEVEVTFFNNEGEFEFVEVNEEKNSVSRKRRTTDIKRTKIIFIKSQEGTQLPFMIRALKVGHINIKVTATSPMAGDGLERPLIVIPSGVTKFKNRALFIDLRNETNFKSDVKIDIPSTAVEDSVHIEASAIGDIMGSSIQNLDKLM
jgi:CD109 antigen